MKKRIAAFLFLFTIGFALHAQQVTVYNSPHDLDETISKLYFSIDKNSFTYVNTEEYKVSPKGSNGQFKGRVKVISFETDDVTRLGSCEPTALLEVPFKILVWQEDGDTFISFSNASNLKHRYMIRDCDDIIQEINKSLIRIVNDAIRTN
ncbi:hypothetical protein [Reichenbachiella sp.]|uniref:hypothetical protein n=1 Tax=Reichenbachiella sp. TaxID=2184521 RepID=UPI003B59D0C5